MSDPVIRSIPLDRLELSPANVRRTAAGKTAFAELKASIAAHGLLENLVVRPLGPGQEGADRYAVIAGGRRLSALTDLVAEDVLAGDCPVPCRVIDNGTADNELSLAENVVRVAMHPADQVQAFGALAHDGATVADIAARFGASERIVEQRLRLGNAAPELLDAYRADEIDLETLKSFAVTTDRARQMAVWEQVREQGYRPSGWQIKRMLTEDRVPATAVTARFVGVETYEDAGGIVDRDLFADEDERGIWLADPVLLDKLASDRLQAAADELATRWNWAEARLDIDWSDLARFGRVQPQPAQPTPEEKAEAERLQVRHDEIVNMDDDEWTEELVAEGDTIETRLDEIDAAIEARAVYRPEDIAIAGCIVTVGRDGNLQLVQGLVRPEDMPPPEQRADTAPGDATAESGATAGIQAPAFSPPPAPPSRQEAETQARKEAGVGIGLADDLRAIRTTLVKAHLAQDFGAAFDLMLFQMGRAVFTPGCHDHALDIAVRETPDRPPLRANDDAFADVSPGEAMLADRSSLPFDWLTMEDEGDAFSALRALSHDDKKRLFAACVARTVKGQLAFEHNVRPELEATLDIAVIDVPVLRLDHRNDRQRLQETVERIRPRLLVLDPLVRLHSVDENTVADIAPILGFLRDLQRRFETAVLLVHHARKSGATRPGQALRGSSELHAWGDSNLYLRRRDGQIVMTVEHRAAPGLNDIEIELADHGQGPALRLRRAVPDEAVPEPETPEQRIVQVIADAEGPLSQRQIRERAATRHGTVGTILGKLVSEGRVERDAAGGYGIAGTGMKKTATPDDAPNSERDPVALRFPVPGSRVS